MSDLYSQYNEIEMQEGKFRRNYFIWCVAFWAAAVVGYLL